jgi:hypothetical protein
MHNFDACVTKLFQAIYIKIVAFVFIFLPILVNIIIYAIRQHGILIFLNSFISHILEFNVLIHYLEYNDNFCWSGDREVQ